jgi:hypothetical protein
VRSAQPVSNLLVAIDDQLFLAREVVIDSLLRHLGLARHVGHRNLFVSLLGKESGGSVGDEPPGPGLLEFTQSRVSDDSSILVTLILRCTTYKVQTRWSVAATAGTISERGMAGLGPRARVCGWPANDVRTGRLVRRVPLVFADEKAAVA